MNNVTRVKSVQVPIEYEQACTAIANCISLDEARYWSDKSDALAAWAKIYHSDDLLRKAKQLKLKAYRRMGEIAAELRPLNIRNGNKGSVKGPRSYLMENGMNGSQADAARGLAKTSPQKFEDLLSNPVAPITAVKMLGERVVPLDLARHMSETRTMIERFSAREVAEAYADCSDGFVEFIGNARDWFDQLENILAKKKQRSSNNA